MKRYELSIDILEENYVDSLVVALARQGYAPYITEKCVCFEINSEELTEIKS